MLKKTKQFILANNVFNNFQVLKPHKKRKIRHDKHKVYQ